MYLRLISLLLILLPAPLAAAQDDVTQWLQRMGCDDLLAEYLENQLEHGDRKSKIRAAKQLADVYAVMLARAGKEDEGRTLQRAISLFDRIPEAGTTDLRLQLYRATYIAAEQILERYRLRISDKDEANIAITQLHEVAEDLSSLREVLLKRIRSSRSQNEKKKLQLGLISSYLAWTRYYLAWYEDDQTQAAIAADIFAEILLGDSPHLQSVSLDLKSHETGARAILGIALCKSILRDPVGSAPWFNELEAPATWSSVRHLVPLWKFFLHVDNKEWERILIDLQAPNSVDQILMFRVAAVHALEDYANPHAKEVAKQSLGLLINGGQLGIVSDVVKSYGTVALEPNGFVSKYIMGDIAFRELVDRYNSDEPATEQVTREAFASIANTFNQAIQASDSSSYRSLIDDCNFMMGLSLFYSSQFQKAAIAFQQASEGNTKEQAVWMAIVAMDHIDPISVSQQNIKDELSNAYLRNWPNTEHATQLTIHQSFESSNPQHIEDLLAVSHSDPKYEDAQRQAARSLYALWQTAAEEELATVGNKYVSVAMTLMIADSTLLDDLHAIEVTSVRAMRILEVSLHQKVLRIVAANRAIDVLDEILARNIFSIEKFQHEINYRNIILFFHEQKYEDAESLLVEIITTAPESRWTTIASTLLWNHWTTNKIQVNDPLLYSVGKQILRDITEYQYGNKEYMNIATSTAQAAFDIYTTTKEPTIGEDALRISRVLVAQKPRVIQILLLNAAIETTLGNPEIALARWKTIAAGSQRGTLQWIEARYQIIFALSTHSPQEALALLHQHHILYPDYGQDPYGSKLEALHQKLLGDLDES